MKNLYFLLLAGILLMNSTIAFAENPAEVQPEIADTEFAISLSERTLTVSFQYSGVAGSVEDANITLLISAERVIGGKTSYFFKANQPKTHAGEKIPNDTITQGKVKFLEKLPDNVKIEELHEICEIGIKLVDSLGNQSPAIVLSVEIPKATGI